MSTIIPAAEPVTLMAVLRRLWALRSRRRRFVATAGLFLVVLAVYPLADWYLRGAGITTPFTFHDFGAYRGAWYSWQTGDPLYTPDNGFHGEYLYPPVWLLLFGAFVEPLAFDHAPMAWGAFCLLSVWIAIQAAAWSFDVRLHPLERIALLWLLFGFHPLLYSIKIAQVTGFLAAMLTLALVGLQLHRRWESRLGGFASGFVTTLGGTMKIIYLPAGAHLLKSPVRFAGAVVGGVALVAVSFGVFGLDPHRGYLDVLLWGKGWDPGRSPALWLPAYFRPLHVFGDWAILVRVVLLVGVVALVVVARGQRAELPVFALGVAAIPLLAPRAYTQDLVVFLPAAIALLAVEFRRDGYPWLVPLGLLFAHAHAYGLRAFVWVYDSVPAAGAIEPLLSVLQPGLWASLLLAGLAAVRVAEETPLPGVVREVVRSARRRF